MTAGRGSAAVFALLLFLGGAVVGVLGDRYYAHSVVHARPTAEAFRERYMNESKSRLHLSDAQVAQLNKILDGTAAKYRALREEHRPEIERINQEQIQQIRSMLTPQQLPAYEAMVGEREHRWKQEHHDHP